MPYVVTEGCIKCKYMDCVETCPVSCFHEGENMLVIDSDECIDCAACVPVCPIDAIVSDDDPRTNEWIELNRKYSKVWLRIVNMGTPPEDAAKWERVENKFIEHFSPLPGTGQGTCASPMPFNRVDLGSAEIKASEK